MWGASKLESRHREGRTLARFGRQGDFMVGVDNAFIHLAKALRLGSRPGLPRADEVDAMLLIRLGILGSTHMVDVTAEDPSSYRFVQYGNRISIHDGKEYSGRTLRDAEWDAVRLLAERDYAYSKRNGEATLAQVELLWNERKIVYRRFIVPLAGDRGEVSHLLVATRPNLLKVVPSSFD